MIKYWAWAPLRDRLRVIVDDHPFELGMSGALVLFGLRAVGNFKAIPAAVDSLPFWLAVAYVSLSIIGGLSVVTGLVGKYRYTWMSGLEKAGLWISASAWASYAVGLILGPFSIRATLLELALLFLVWSCLMRVRAITRRDATRRQALEDIKRRRDEAEGTD